MVRLKGVRSSTEQQAVPRPIRIKGCPQCGGTELSFETAMLTGNRYHCLDCDYVGALVVEGTADGQKRPPTDQAQR